MEIRDAEEGQEHCYTDYGEEFRCPICNAVWFRSEQDDYASGTCEHLRFTLDDEAGEDFIFFNEWDTDGFLELVDKTHKKLLELELKNDEEQDVDDIYIDVLDILEQIQHVDVDKIFIYGWFEESCHPWMLWGYKK